MTKMNFLLFLFLFISLNLFSIPNVDPTMDLPIDAPTRSQVISQVLKHLNDSYVFLDVAKKMASTINSRLVSGSYDAITSSSKFAEALTLQLREVSKDKHLVVSFSFNKIPLDQKNQPTPEEIARVAALHRSMNYGFRKTEILPGNVGYIAFDRFNDLKSASSAASAAMAFVANTDALILDIRQNTGGKPDMVAFLSSYFFARKPVHLNDLYYRSSNTTRHWWTRRNVPGQRYLNKEIYLLTSGVTFSAAEEFAYNLKSLKRAIIVGEPTKGGAHPGGVKRINDHFSIWVPMGRAINPITKTNWEGVGVTPDIAVEPALALEAAHKSALNSLLGKTVDPNRAAIIKSALEQKLPSN